jgi:hypothetical protein
MAWTSPMTFVSGGVLTAAQMNTYLRDNFNETAPAKATYTSTIFVGAGANSIVERAITTAAVLTSETTNSVTYAQLATPGPAVTVTTGPCAIVATSAFVRNNTAGNACAVDWVCGGATVIADGDQRSLQFISTGANQALRASRVYHETSLTAGSNTFTCHYRVDGGIGTFLDRFITVIPL